MGLLIAEATRQRTKNKKTYNKQNPFVMYMLGPPPPPSVHHRFSFATFSSSHVLPSSQLFIPYCLFCVSSIISPSSEGLFLLSILFLLLFASHPRVSERNQGDQNRFRRDIIFLFLFFLTLVVLGQLKKRKSTLWPLEVLITLILPLYDQAPVPFMDSGDI